MRGHIAVVVALVAALWSGDARAQGCACPTARPPAVAMAEADAVFEGQVTGVREGAYAATGGALVAGRWATLLVLREWKGATAGTTRQVFTPASCAVGFEAGTSWLVYARSSSDNHELRSTRCHRTRRVAEAREDLLALGIPDTQIEAVSGATAARPTGARRVGPRGVVRRVLRPRRRRPRR